MSDCPEPVPRTILCTHDPATFAKSTAPVAFAGHLHGGQCVLATIGDKLYPGCLFNRLTALRLTDHHRTCLVSRGLADVLPLRFNCPLEVILCQAS